MLQLHANSDSLTRNALPRGLLYCREGCLATREQTWVSPPDWPALGSRGTRSQLRLQLSQMWRGASPRDTVSLGLAYCRLFRWPPAFPLRGQAALAGLGKRRVWRRCRFCRALPVGGPVPFLLGGEPSVPWAPQFCRPGYDRVVAASPSLLCSAAWSWPLPFCVVCGLGAGRVWSK